MSDKNCLKIVFFGLGSIGIRHAKIINDHYQHELYAYRTKLGQERINKDALGIVEIADIDDVWKIKPDIAFITNPTFLHIKTAMECAQNGVDLFIEKPLSHDPDNLDELKHMIQKNNLFTYVAFNMRFHPVMEKIKEMIEGVNVVYSRTICTSYLPDWRKNQDYRKSFSSSSEKGGGLLLELMHELDYNYWLFGGIKNIDGRYGKLSNLEIGSEDYGDMMLEHENGVISNIHLNWFTKKIERKIMIYCEDSYIEGDMINNKVNVIDKEGSMKTYDFRVERNDIYKRQLDYFFKRYENREETMNDIFEAEKVLKYLINFKKKNTPAGRW